LTTSPPRHAIRNAKNATLPHCPGETHTSPLASIIATTPRFVGLNRCLPLIRITNLLAMVTMAAAMARRREFVRRSRHSESPEMRALRGSNAGRRQSRVHTNCVRSDVPIIDAAWMSGISKSSRTSP
jgi:hypothetical protein